MQHYFFYLLDLPFKLLQKRKKKLETREKNQQNE